MNVFENVMLTADTNYVPSKYVVMSCTVGSTLATSWCWVRCVSYGVDTEEHLNEYYNSQNRSLLSGTLGEYKVVNLTQIKPYYRRASVKETNVDIG